MADHGDHPSEVLRAELQKLFFSVRRPTYRGLSGHADRAGRVLRVSTIGDLLNGPGTPRWETVEAFVLGCARHAQAHRIAVPADAFDLGRWHDRYRSLAAVVAESAAPAPAPGDRRESRPPHQATPAQLPIDLPTFAGRAQQLADLDRLLLSADSPTAVVISAIDGTAGIGKTALAVRWAHRIADKFPDGQLYVNLRGFDPDSAALDPGEVVRGFLDALQVNPQRVPATLDAQAALFRSLLTGRRMLIVLDNARDSDQVRHLLPGTPGCFVVVTSRNLLIGLQATHDAHPLTLDLLSPRESRDLLAQRLGTARVAGEPDAVDELVTACARLPVALAIAAARAKQTGFPLAALAAELRDLGQRLDALDTGDPSSQIRTVFSWSYATLTPPAARLFRLLGLHPGPDFAPWAAASLAGLSLPETRRLLAELTRANLLTEHVPGRYTFHDLLRAYAAEQAHAVDTEQQRHVAIGRLLDHYLRTGFAGERLLHPLRLPIDLVAAQPDVTPRRLADDRQASDWFSAERLALLAAIERAGTAGFDAHAWQIFWTMQSFVLRRGHWHDCVAAGRVAVAAAGRLGDPDGMLRTRRIVADAHAKLGNFDDAHDQLRHALDVGVRTDDRVGQGHIHVSMAHLWATQKEDRRALEHARTAFDLFRTGGHSGGTAYALSAMGMSQARLGEHEAALDALRQALALHQEGNNPYGAAWAWDSIGYSHHQVGDHAEAVSCYGQALALYRDADDRYEQSCVLTHLGDAHQAVGDSDAARNAWQQALTILDEMDHPEADDVRGRLAFRGSAPVQARE